MRPIDLPFFVELGGAFEDASNIDAKGSVWSAFFRLHRLRLSLRGLMAGEQARLTACGHDFADLLNEIDAFERRHFRDQDGNWTNPPDDAQSEYEIGVIVSKLNRFKIVLIADLRITASFTVTKSGIFDVNQLVNRAHYSLPNDLKAKLPSQVFEEVDAAGRCLAFSLSTASGFHAMRAVERVIKVYLAKFFDSETVSKFKNWGQFLEALERKQREGEEPRPSVEAIALIKQIKDIYRNPVIHPDRVLTQDEAMSLFYSSVAAISRIGAEIEKEEPKIPGLLNLLSGGRDRYSGAASLLSDDGEAA